MSVEKVRKERDRLGSSSATLWADVRRLEAGRVFVDFVPTTCGVSFRDSSFELVCGHDCFMNSHFVSHLVLRIL